MKRTLLCSFLFVLAGAGYAQESPVERRVGTDIALSSYSDFTVSKLVPQYWLAVDHQLLATELRYNYDWNRNFSLYAGLALSGKLWKLRMLEGITTGSGATGFSSAPILIVESRKFYFYNGPQLIVGLSRMPNNFFHWGEMYYKLASWIWPGISDRVYLDTQKNQDISYGTQLLFPFKGLSVVLYYWVPTTLTQNRYSVFLGYEKLFSARPNAHHQTR